MKSARLALAFLVTVLGSAVCELDTCDDAFQLFVKYLIIWMDTNVAFENESPNVDSLTEMYTTKYLEDYARHICSVVKPQALSSFRNEVANCSNIDEIMAMVDENEGFCRNNGLSNRIRTSIINHLRPVNNSIQCSRIGNNYDCYGIAALQLEIATYNGLSFNSFHNEIDKFFASIWECQVKVFKSHAHICPHWQLPMLLSLDTVTVLFRSKITDQQIAMLELERATTTRTSVKKGKKKKKKKKTKFGKVKTTTGNNIKIGKLPKKTSIGTKSKTGRKKSG